MANMYLTPAFLQDMRMKMKNDGVHPDDADRHIGRFISSKVPDFASQYKDNEQRTRGDGQARTSFLNWKIYGTTKPATEQIPEQIQPEREGIDFSGQIGGEALTAMQDRKRQGSMYQDTYLGKMAEAVTPSGLTSTEPGLFTRIGDRISERGVRVNELNQQSAANPGNTTEGRTARIGILSNMLGGVADVGGEVLKTASGVLPNFIQQGIGLIAQDLGVPDAAQQMSNSYMEWSKAHPEAAVALEAVGNLGRAGVTAYGTQALAGQVQRGATGVKEFMNSPPPALKPPVAAVPTKSAPTGVEKLAQPKPNQEELFKASREGRAILNRAGEPTGIASSTRETEIAESMRQSGVTDKMKTAQATERVGKGIAESGKQVEAEISANNYAFNDKEYSGIFRGAKAQAVDDAVITSTSEGKVFDSVANLYQKKFQSILKAPIAEGGAGGNRLLAVYKTRKIMDKLAPPKTFGGDAVLAAKTNAFRYFRDASNEFLAKSLEVGGSQYGKTMRHMSNLFRALDNLETTTQRSLAPTDLQKALNIGKKAVFGAAVYAGARKLPIIGDVLP